MTVLHTTQTAQASNALNALLAQCLMRHCVNRLFRWLNSAPAKPPKAPKAVNKSNSHTLKFAFPSDVLYVNSPNENIFVLSAEPHKSSDVLTTYNVYMVIIPQKKALQVN